MDNNDLKERDFEAYIEHWLTTEGGYVKGSQTTYDKERALDLKTLIKFLRMTQTKKWELYEKKYGAQTEDRLYNVLQDKIHERGLIWVLRNGIDDLGIKLRMCYFRPASELNEELMLKYRQSFKRRDKERFTAYLSDVSAGKEKIHCETLFPYQILRPYLSGCWGTADPCGKETLEALWENLPREFGNENAISVIDTSGSMYCGFQGNAVTPALIAISLGLYHAERCKGCELCVFTCDKQVLGMSTAVNSKGYHYAYMANPESCIGCTNCGIICPDGVISVYRVKVEE